jgi:hypothetical protein
VDARSSAFNVQGAADLQPVLEVLNGGLTTHKGINGAILQLALDLQGQG